MNYVACRGDVFIFLSPYRKGVPGVLADGQNVQDTLRIGRAAINHVRTKGPAILQVHTFRFNGKGA